MFRRKTDRSKRSGPVIPALITGPTIVIAAILAWFLTHRQRAGTTAVSLVVLIALLTIPRLFVVDGLLLADGKGLSSSHLAVIAGLDVGAVALAFLAFFVVGFVTPLIGASLEFRRGHAGSRETLAVHGALFGVAALLIGLSTLPIGRDAQFHLFKIQRERVVSEIASGAKLTQTAGRRDLQLYVPPGVFPRLACCGNVVYVLEGGRRILFPMSAFGAASWGYVHDASPTDAPPLRTVHGYGDGWRRVRIDWTTSNPKAD
jgi:hypothetical protein